jgi:hypothetical protein
MGLGHKGLLGLGQRDLSIVRLLSVASSKWSAGRSYLRWPNLIVG